jgi:V/A-type H+-transporting ATPase subunit A
VDTYTSLLKQLKMLKLIAEFHRLSLNALSSYASLNDILATPSKEKIGRAKYIPEENIGELDEIYKQMVAELTSLAKGAEEDV